MVRKGHQGLGGQGEVWGHLPFSVKQGQESNLFPEFLLVWGPELGPNVQWGRHCLHQSPQTEGREAIRMTPCCASDESLGSPAWDWTLPASLHPTGRPWSPYLALFALDAGMLRAHLCPITVIFSDMILSGGCLSHLALSSAGWLSSLRMLGLELEECHFKSFFEIGRKHLLFTHCLVATVCSPSSHWLARRFHHLLRTLLCGLC